MNTSEIVTIIVSSLSGIIIAYFGLRSKKQEQNFKLEMANREKKQNDEAEKRAKQQGEKLEKVVKILTDKVSIVEAAVNEFDELLRKHIGEDNLKKDFSKYTAGIANELIEKNLTLNPVYKSALSYWGELMEKFIRKYHSSESRYKSKRDRRRMVQEQKRKIHSQFDSFLDSELQYTQNYKASKIRFTDFLRQLNVYASFDTLVVDLERNGLDDTQLNEKFGDQVDKFCELFITSSVTWDLLKQNTNAA